MGVIIRYPVFQYLVYLFFHIYFDGVPYIFIHFCRIFIRSSFNLFAIKRNDNLMYISTLFSTFIYDSVISVFNQHICYIIWYTCPRFCSSILSVVFYSFNEFHWFHIIFVPHICIITGSLFRFSRCLFYFIHHCIGYIFRIKRIGDVQIHLIYFFFPIFRIQIFHVRYSNQSKNILKPCLFAI